MNVYYGGMLRKIFFKSIGFEDSFDDRVANT